jgi:hypothetical protein
MALIDLRNAVMLLTGGSGDAYVEIKIGQGNLTYNERRQIDEVKSRGKLDTIRENEDETMQVAFSFMWEIIKSEGTEDKTIEDALKGRAGLTSASGDPNAPFCVNIQITHDPSCPGVKSEIIILPQFHYTELAHSIQDATIACNGICNAREPIITRI